MSTTDTLDDHDRGLSHDLPTLLQPGDGCSNAPDGAPELVSALGRLCHLRRSEAGNGRPRRQLRRAATDSRPKFRG